ncbi:hypothetical protein cyc_04164 [Cyclospora cayetanensis]|uniref:Uncharacterized protein n=1 Tax=Cyclospora cayetanensis TaxID=88456 RepID=A0A1D3D5A7_9EIME|nr:hypothetical protein cyc_04164 [Cyclospora cayetanensis]
MKGAIQHSAAVEDQTEAASLPIQGPITGQEFVASLDTGCEGIRLPSGDTAHMWSLSVNEEAHSFKFRFADRWQNERDSEAVAAECHFRFGSGNICVVYGIYVGLVHHDEILSLPWVVQWKERMQAQLRVVEIDVPGHARK